MPIENYEFWQEYRPNGFLIESDTHDGPALDRNLEVRTEDSFRPSPEFFGEILNCGLDDDSILKFTNRFGLLTAHNVPINKQHKYKDPWIISVIQEHMERVHMFFNSYDFNNSDWIDYDTVISSWDDYVSNFVEVHLLKDDKGILIQRIVPTDLLAHVWLNICDFATGKKGFAQCQYSKCTRWYELDLNKRGPKNMYCSASHKSAAYLEGKSTCDQPLLK